MLYTSRVFLLLLPVLLLGYYALPRRAQPTCLLLAGLFFYAGCGWQNLLLFVFLVAVTYLAARRLFSLSARENATLLAHADWDKPTRKAYRAACRKKRDRLLAAAIALIVTAFVLVKGTSLLRALPSLPVIVRAPLVPLGFSFLTLQAIGYLVDLSRGQIQTPPTLFHTALLLSFFPQLCQGPLCRYDELLPALVTPHVPDASRISSGALRALWGYTKKLIVADTAAIATQALRGERSGVGTVALLLLYSVQIYADFTGGMDIALGISECFGITLPENFDHPFAAPSVKEYWRRWHITLGRFFTDYVFYPLSASRPAQWLSRAARRLFGDKLGRRLPVGLALLLTWALTGLWHGFRWNFLVWGLLNGAFMLLSLTLTPLRRRLAMRFPRVANSRAWYVLCCVGTFLIVGLFRTLDVYGDVPLAFTQWGYILTAPGLAAVTDSTFWQSLGLKPSQWILLGAGVLLMTLVSRLTHLRDTLRAKPLATALTGAVLLTAVLIFGRYGFGYDPLDFIYGQF